jgi:CheY-like chemotaxis protein
MSASNRARDLVQQILAFSRRQKRQWRVISLQPVVEEALNLLRSALPASVRMVSEIQPGLPPILGDPTQIHQVLMNLCANAEYAMRHRPGEIHVSLKQARVADLQSSERTGVPVGDYLVLLVRDSGCGMTEETRKRIFEPFFTTKPTGEGTGLGLAAVHGIVKDHNGTIFVTSEVDIGTEFQVYLPALAAATPVENPIPPEPFIISGAGGHILLVDDEPAICTALTAILKRSGFQVTAHTSPMAALKEFRQNPGRFNLVFTDLNMPGLSGIELGRELMKIRVVPVILATGFSGDWTAETARSAGVLKVLQKPLEMRTLCDHIQQVLLEN